MSNHCNLFSVIKQGILSKKLRVRVKNCKFFISILSILYNNGYIRFFTVSKDSLFINIFLKYKNMESVIQDIYIYSKPSNRFYISHKKLKELCKEKNMFGIISTSSGLLSIDSCLFYKKGGELLCLIE